MKAAKESLFELAEAAHKNSAVVAVENLPRTCLGRSSEEICELIGTHPSLRVCFDTNHLLEEDFESFLDRVGERLVTVHISDYDRVNERHWMPGEGVTDWSRLLSCLEGIGYGGAFMYEIGFACPKTILRPRDLTCEDFVKNAIELFAGAAPTVISTKKPNLGFWE